jgi:parallel beta-helix repeat protein
MKTIRNVKIWLVMAVFLSAMAGTSFGGKIIYVDAYAPGNNDGSSWTNAYRYLQNGLADAKSSAKPVDIRVAQGVYKPDEDTLHPAGTGDRTAAFQLINGVTIKGGYSGTQMSLLGADPDARDIALYQTILSGNIGAPSDANDNIYHIFYHPEGLNLNNTAILDGFTITGGNANGSWPHSSGGGMFNWENSPTVDNCTFTANSALSSGGGMFNAYYSSPTVKGCTFSTNSAAHGGGIYTFTSSPTVKGCTFTDNLATLRGAGMHIYDSSPTIIDCTFTNNSANDGGGMYNNWFSKPTVMSCTFTDNSANKGGGMHNYKSSPLVNDCTFTNNSAEYGGGMYNEDSSPRVKGPTVKGCTIANNSAVSGPAVACDSYRQNFQAP